jgi:hypothetical protein
MDTMALRRRVLAACGATGDTVDALIALGDQRHRPLPDRPACLPLEDEPHVEAWTRYERAARERGACQELRDRFVQLQFPIQEGISRDSAYRAATLGGEFYHAAAFEPGLQLASPSTVRLDVWPSIGGCIPVLTVENRADFVALVRAFSERNEPADIPASVGACIVSGINNWDRIARHREAWEQAGGELAGSWTEEFRQLAGRKDQYQDRLILLSSGPYSDVAAGDVGLDTASWLEHSLVIRREHEFTHYFIYRLCGMLRQTILDELLADFVGLVKAFGTYRVDLARRFLGIEAFPRFRPGGRLEYYQRHQPLTPSAFTVLTVLAWMATDNLHRVARKWAGHLGTHKGLATVVHAIGCLTLEECAAEDLPGRLGGVLGDQKE